MLLAGVLLFVLGVQADVVVRPEAQRIKTPGSGVLTCVFPAPLDECLIRVSNNHYDLSREYFDKLLNFSSGVGSPRQDIHSQFSTSYAGNGLDPAGECGVKFDIEEHKNSVMFVECFGRSLEGQWGRGFGQVSTSVHEPLPVTISPPRHLAAAAGTSVSVLLRADRKLDHCYITTPLAGELYLFPGEPLPPGSRYLEYGAGLGNQECGVQLQDVQEEDAGVWSTRAYNTRSSQFEDYTAFEATVVLVKAAPVGLHTLDIVNADHLKPGDMLHATCQTPTAVPAPNITWLLGNEVVRQDDLNTTLPGDVGKNRPWHRQPRRQTFVRRLTAEDFGKRLACKMGHEALTSPGVIAHDLPALYLEAEKAVVRSGVGFRSQLTCIVDSQLDATVQWRRAGVPVEESSVVVASNNGSHHWLSFEDTESEDFDDYTCTASAGDWSMSQVIKLTGLPGTPEWTTPPSSSHLAWRVESVTPLTSCLLKIHRGTERWGQHELVADASRLDDSWFLVPYSIPYDRLGNFSAYLTVNNEQGKSKPSQIHHFSVSVLKFRLSGETVSTAPETAAEQVASTAPETAV